MTFLRLLFHFLGSVHLAITLIFFSAIAVIGGTFVESLTESHQHAAKLTYDNPAFQLVLWLYFVNILVAALRRWPFKVKHIPFLLTHLGLLMLLGGTLVKSYVGTQGTLLLVEGGESDRLILLDRPVLHIEDGDAYEQWDVTEETISPPQGSALQAQLLAYAPNSKRTLAGWMHDEVGTIVGLPPLPMGRETRVPLRPGENWKFLPLTTLLPEKVIREVIIQDSLLHLTDSSSDRHLLSVPLAEAIAAPVPLPSGDLYVTLTDSTLTLEWKNETITLPLEGDRAGVASRTSTPFIGAPSLLPSLSREPTLLIINSDLLVALDPYGRIQRHTFNSEELSSYIAYDRGYGGYGLSVNIPLYPPPSDRHGYELLANELQQWVDPSTPLSPPLALLREAAGEEFLDIWMAFLQEWDRSATWLYPVRRPLPTKVAAAMGRLTWSESEKKQARWLAALQVPMVDDYLAGKSLLDTLEEMQWPLLEDLKGIEAVDEQLLIHGQQLLALADELPEIDTPDPASPEESAALLSALLRGYGLHYRRLHPPEGWAPSEPIDTIELETPLTASYEVAEPLLKWEDNAPLISVKLNDGRNEEIHTLAYDRFGTGMKWPALSGSRMLRFQPQLQEIPYTLRLRKTRQINYAGDNQPFAYESDLYVTDKRSGTRSSVRISMNNVHETWDGYRFYMSNITPTDGISAKRAQIVVNHDPAKYTLTYPGGAILSLGIVLLFGLRPYQPKKQRKAT